MDSRQVAAGWGEGAGLTLTHKTSASCSPPPPTTDTETRWQTEEMGGGQVSAGATPPPTGRPQGPPRFTRKSHPQQASACSPEPGSSLDDSPKGCLVCGPKPPSPFGPGWHPGLTQFLPRGSRGRKEEEERADGDSSLCTTASLPKPGDRWPLGGYSPQTLPTEKCLVHGSPTLPHSWCESQLPARSSTFQRASEGFPGAVPAAHGGGRERASGPSPASSFSDPPCPKLGP